MPDFTTLEPTRDKFFHVEWETTLKCNLDCSYCGDGHDNSLEHPSLAESLNTVDFIFEYVDYYMQLKPQSQRHVNINVFGGESLFHPKIIDILKYTRKKREEYKNFSCNVSTITNAIVGQNLWKRIVELLDYFTISFHAESLPKQRDLLKHNILYLKEQNKNFQVNIMMHPKYWDDCIAMEQWCKENNITYHKRQIDHSWFDRRFNYSSEQTEYLTGQKPVGVTVIALAALTGSIDLSSQGRACCGGQKMCCNNSTSDYVYGNNFKNWHCSVNEFFLYIRQNTGEVYTNKDCKMNFDNSVGPIGYLSDTKKILAAIKTNPEIVCKKRSCWCGLCAPKAKTKSEFDQIMIKYRNEIS
jgi:pyruvate-formate lyase-activating enzyme